MHREANGRGSVVRMPSTGMQSLKLKTFLRRADVDRAELYETDSTRKAITFHDLRATAITWMAVRGTDALKIMQRAGHSGFATTQIYLREAENLRDGFGEVFPSLPADLLERPKSARGVSASLSAFRRRSPHASAGFPPQFVGAIGIEPTTPTVSKQRDRVADRYGSLPFARLREPGVARRSISLRRSGAPGGAPKGGAPPRDPATPLTWAQRATNRRL